MQNYSNNLINMEYMNKLFDCIRLIDVEFKSIYQEKRIDTCVDFIPEFNFEHRQDIYHQCLAQDSAIYLSKKESHCLLMYVVLPTLVDKKRLVMECIVNMTKRLDINQLYNSNDNLYKLAITDELTGAYNRRYINQKLPLAIEKCFKNRIPLSLIFLDIDSFKIVNDLYGHEAGDYLLCEFVEELQNITKENTDWVARYGGDEFLLCLTGMDNLDAKEIAELIRETVEQKLFVYSGHRIEITCSIGVYTVDSFHAIPKFEKILREVDIKLYEAKKAGRNKVKH